MAVSRWATLGALALSSTLLCASPSLARPALTVLTDDNPPLAFQDATGEFKGFTVALLKAAAKSSETEIHFERQPWPRAYQRGFSQANTCLLGIGRTAERESKLQWVGPFAVGGISLFGLAERKFDIKDIDEVVRKGYSVGLAHDDVASVLRTRYPGLHVEDLSLQTFGPRMLALNRFDLWGSGRILGTYKLQMAGVQAVEVLKVSTVDISMGCNLRTDAPTLGKIQDALGKLLRSPEGAKIKSEWLTIP